MTPIRIPTRIILLALATCLVALVYLPLATGAAQILSVQAYTWTAGDFSLPDITYASISISPNPISG